jgi:hypothetical protein
LAFRLRKIEKVKQANHESNFHCSQAQFNYNVNKNKADVPVIIYNKIDDQLPFGAFEIDVIFTTLNENEAFYTSNSLMFSAEKEFQTFVINRAQEKESQKKPESKPVQENLE